jgi:hypothetical protein
MVKYGRREGLIIMFTELLENYIVVYFLYVLFGIGVFVKLIMLFVYSGLMKASDQMGTSKNKLMKLLRLKYETCYKLKIGVNNVDTFVDKYVYKHKFCGILLCTWESIGGQVIMLSIVISTMGGVLGLVYDCGKDVILSTFFVGVFTSVLLIILENMLNLKIKRKIVRVNIKDYLVNFLKARLENECLNPQMIDQYRKEYFQGEDVKEGEKNKPNKIMQDKEVSIGVEEMAVSEQSLGETPKVDRKYTKINDSDKKDEKIIEEILKEYLP